MSLLGFEKDTLLDLSVNVIPLGIIFFFVVIYAVVPAFGTDPVFSALQFSLLLVTFSALAILTYFAGRAVEGAERSREESAE